MQYEVILLIQLFSKSVHSFAMYVCIYTNQVDKNMCKDVCLQ